MQAQELGVASLVELGRNERPVEHALASVKEQRVREGGAQGLRHALSAVDAEDPPGIGFVVETSLAPPAGLTMPTT